MHFICNYDYTGQSEKELSFSAGDKILVLKTEGEWYYGEHNQTKKRGLVPPTYGHTRQESPYKNQSESVLHEKRAAVLKTIVSSQSEFILSLQEFIENVIKTMDLRDTPFKRTFLSDPAVAVCFSLLQELANACSNFETSLKAAQGDSELSYAYLQFAPSLQIFAQYASENPKLLNAVTTNQRQLAPLIPTGQRLEATLVQPLEFYANYKKDLQEYVWLTHENNEYYEQLYSALDAIIAQTDYVDAKLQEEAESLMLLELQSQFSGNPTIFTPSRKLLKEGELERIREKSNGELDVKVYVCHLFNDAFMYSSRSSLSGAFKLHTLFELKTTVFDRHKIGGVTNGFSLKLKNDKKPGLFRFADDNQAIEWFDLIEKQIEFCKVKKIEKRSSVLMINKTTTSIPGVDATKLGARGTIVHRFLLTEIPFANAVAEMNFVAIQPLIDASKGATLCAEKPDKGGSSMRDSSKSDIGRHQLNGVAQLTKYQAQSITDSLQQEADCKIFLRAAEGLSLALADFVKSLEAFCNNASWAETVAVGSFFSSVSARSLYNQYKAYASGLQAMLRTLKLPPFQQFLLDSDYYLSGSLLTKLEVPGNKIQQYISFLSDLQRSTAASHPDLKALTQSLEILGDVENEIKTVVALKKNFEKLLEIQSSLVSVSLMSNEPILQKLASMDRQLLLESDLKKVCRKKNKTFRFWLFNDVIIYASALGGGTFSFNRCLDVAKANAAPHIASDLKYAFELHGAEKSFIVIAPDSSTQRQWIDGIQKARAALLPAGAPEVDIAPLWVPDSGSDTCTSCNKSFTFFNRRHHCRKCGALVCSEHLKNSMVLPHIHKSVKQKVCDKCVTNLANSTSTPNTPSSSKQNTAQSKATNSSTSKPTTSGSSSKQTTTPASPTVPSGTSNPPTMNHMTLKQAAPASTPPPLPSSPPPPVPTSTVSDDRPDSWRTQQLNNPTKKAPVTSLYAFAETANTPKSPTAAVHSTVSPLKKKWPPDIPASAPPPLPSTAPPPLPSSPPPPVPASTTTTSSAPISRTNASSTSSTTTTVKPAVTIRRRPPPPSITGEKNDAKGGSRARTAPPPPSEGVLKVPSPAESSSVSALPLSPSSGPARRTPPPPVAPPAVSPISPPGGAGPRSPPPRPPPPPPRGPPMAPAGPPRVAPPSQTRVPPPPMSPPAPVAQEPAQESNENDEFRKFRKMKDMLPAGAVRQKMISEGFAEADIEDFLEGRVNTLPMPSGGSMPSITATPTLRSAPAPEQRPKSARKMSVLDEIQMGRKLKAVKEEDNRMKAKSIRGAGGLLGMLANEMSKRRFQMKEVENDSDSDSGFSDSDSDSD